MHVVICLIYEEPCKGSLSVTCIQEFVHQYIKGSLNGRALADERKNCMREFCKDQVSRFQQGSVNLSVLLLLEMKGILMS